MNYYTYNIKRRTEEHARKVIQSFTSKYNVVKLIWCERFATPEEAIAAEKKIKRWKREKKPALIKTINPKFADLLRGDPLRRSG